MQYQKGIEFLRLNVFPKLLFKKLLWKLDLLHRSYLRTLRPCGHYRNIIVVHIIVVHAAPWTGHERIVIIRIVRRAEPEIIYNSIPICIHVTNDTSYEELRFITFSLLHTFCYHFSPMLLAGFDNHKASLLSVHTALAGYTAVP